MDISIANRIIDKIITDMHSADTLVEHLHKQGYTQNFILVDNKIMCLQTCDYYLPSDLQVDEIYHIDEDVIGFKGYYIYALRHGPDRLKGIFAAYLAQDIVI